MKIAFRFRLRLRRLRSARSPWFRLWSSENQIVGVGSTSGRTKPMTKRGNVLPTPTIWFSLHYKRNKSDGVVSGVARKWKRSDSSDSDSDSLVLCCLVFIIFTFYYLAFFYKFITQIYVFFFPFKFLILILYQAKSHTMDVLILNRYYYHYYYYYCYLG